MYIDLGFRHEVFHLEAMCINGICIAIPIEYAISTILILVTFPTAHVSPSMQFPLLFGLTINLSLGYFIALFVSLPLFMSTIIYLWRKREQQI